MWMRATRRSGHRPPLFERLPQLAGALLVITGLTGCDPLYLLEPGNEPTGTVHEDPITDDETWRASDNPHRVHGQVLVAGPNAPTLTLEAGVRVLFARGAGLSIGTRDDPGSLQALGTNSEPIEFESALEFQSRGYWGAVHFAHAAGPSRLEHMTIRDCGGTADWPEACLRVVGMGTGPVMRNVTIAFSEGYGFAAIGGGFGEGSEGVRIGATRASPLRIGPNQVDQLPEELSFFAQATPVIEIGGGHIFDSLTWPVTGLPYVVVGAVRVAAPGTPTLTLQRGTELIFGRSGEIVVGGENGPGALRAEGRESDPVIFTAVDPQPGSWNGITFHANASSESLLNGAVVEYGGRANGYSKANITFFTDLGPVVRNSVIRRSDGCGVVQLAFDGQWTTDLTVQALGNQFSDNTFADQCTQG